MNKTAFLIKPRTHKESHRGAKITQPNKAVNPSAALARMALGTMEHRAQAFYDKEGLPAPDFQMMDKIEKLRALNEFREMKIKSLDKLDKLQKKSDRMEKAQIKAEQDKKLVHEQKTTDDRTGTKGQ